MVECELGRYDNEASRHHVLIDTWWNVNICATPDKGYWIAVLIDTWWNVNV